MEPSKVLKCIQRPAYHHHSFLSKWKNCCEKDSNLRYRSLGLIFFLSTVRSWSPPQYGRVFKSGQKRLISSFQLFSTEAGATTKKGPHIFFSWMGQETRVTTKRIYKYKTLGSILTSAKWAKNAMAWMVFPRPISSASIPFKPWKKRSQKKWTLACN